MANYIIKDMPEGMGIIRHHHQRRRLTQILGEKKIK